jgi:hypothetical protein
MAESYLLPNMKVKDKALNLVVMGSSPTVGAKCWDRWLRAIYSRT